MTLRTLGILLLIPLVAIIALAPRRVARRIGDEDVVARLRAGGGL